MIRLFPVLVIFAATFYSCGREAPPMKQDTMVNILADIHIVESILTSETRSQYKDSLEVIYLAQVLDNWGTTEDEFETALNHMHRNPDYMIDVYELVKQRILQLSKKVDEEEGENELNQLQ